MHRHRGEIPSILLFTHLNEIISYYRAHSRYQGKPNLFLSLTLISSICTSGVYNCDN